MSLRRAGVPGMSHIQPMSDDLAWTSLLAGRPLRGYDAAVNVAMEPASHSAGYRTTTKGDRTAKDAELKASQTAM